MLMHYKKDMFFARNISGFVIIFLQCLSYDAVGSA